jgi:hypothetical protein
MSAAVDIEIDWNEEDDTGLPWTFVDRARKPLRDRSGSVCNCRPRDVPRCRRGGRHR